MLFLVLCTIDVDLAEVLHQEGGLFHGLPRVLELALDRLTKLVIINFGTDFLMNVLKLPELLLEGTQLLFYLFCEIFILRSDQGIGESLCVSVTDLGVLASVLLFLCTNCV